MTLSEAEQQVLGFLEGYGEPATAQLIADTTGITKSYARDIVSQLRSKGYDVPNDGSGYYIEANSGVRVATHSETESRVDSSTKGSITKEAKSTLAEMESELVERLSDRTPAVSDVEAHTPGGTTVAFHRTDDHFGDEYRDQDGNVIHDSDAAEDRVDKYFAEGLRRIEARRDAGQEIDNAVLLLGGDIVTNESIYEGQAHEIDEDLYEQIERASQVYTRHIRHLAERFDSVKVVCQAGNHGELRASGSSTAANADDILYLMLDSVVRASGLDNVTFIQSDYTYYVNFSIRDWNGHLRHGHDASLEHIGTSAGKQRWLAWLTEHDFDIAFRGHYHQYKEEPIAGRPVIMGGTVAPTSEFEESRAMTGGKPCGAIHGVTDEQVLDWTERIYFD